MTDDKTNDKTGEIICRLVAIEELITDEFDLVYTII